MMRNGVTIPLPSAFSRPPNCRVSTARGTSGRTSSWARASARRFRPIRSTSPKRARSGAPGADLLLDEDDAQWIGLEGRRLVGLPDQIGQLHLDAVADDDAVVLVPRPGRDGADPVGQRAAEV